MRALIYDRVSVADEQSQQEHLRRCRAFCESRSWQIVAEHVDTASGFTRTARRPGWDRVVAAVESGDVDAVVVFAVSRAGRNLASFARFVELCRDHSVTFASATEPVDTAGAFGRVFLALLSALAEMESATKRERALLGRAIAAREGTFTGGTRRFGFDRDDETKLVHVVESEAALMREAATEVLNGVSLEAVARRWNAAGVTTTGGKRWYPGHLRTVLGAEKNAPAILTSSDVRRLRALFDSRRIGRAPGRFLLSGLLRCGVCGHRLTGRGTRYACYRATESPKIHLTIVADLLDQHVYRLVMERAQSHPFAETEARDPSDDLVQKRERIVSALEALGDSDLSEHVIRGRERRLLRELEGVESRMETAAPPRRRTFAEVYTPDDVFIRRYVRSITVESRRGGNRFDPSRVRVEYQR